MPVTDTTSVTSRPPHSLVSTIGKPPRSSPITAMTTPMPAKIARLTISARHPRRMPPLRKNSSAETITAVAAKSAHTGRPTPELIAQPGQRQDHVTSVPSSATSLPSSASTDRHASAACTAVYGHPRRCCRPIPTEVGGPTDAKPAQAAAMQQEKRHDRKRDEEQPGVEALGRQPRNQQRQQQQRRKDERQVDPPALRLGIKAVDELGEFRLHIRPARADRVAGVFREAGVAIGAGPDRIDQQESDRRHHGEPQQQRAQRWSAGCWSAN